MSGSSCFRKLLFSRCNASTALIFALLLVPARVQAQQAQASSPWDAWKFLVGDWVGEGSGEPGQGSGSFTFGFDLQGKILVRKNRSDYPATKDRPAFSHEDMMVIYPEPGGNTMRAVYWDNEGHVIQYTAEFSEDRKTLAFISDPLLSAPRFRLSYIKEAGERLKIRFEIAPPGKPDAFATYLEAAARRKTSP